MKRPGDFNHPNKTTDVADIGYFATSHFLTYDTAVFSIPEDALIVWAVCFHENKASTAIKTPQFCQSKYLKAGINLANALLKDDKGTEVMVLITAALGAKSTEEEKCEKFKKAGDDYVASNTVFFNLINGKPVKFSRWAKWRVNTEYTNILFPSKSNNTNNQMDLIIEVFDELSSSFSSKIANIEPTFDELKEYVNHMYQNEKCPYQSDFKQTVDKLVNARIGKSHSNYTEEGSKEIDSDKLKEHNYLIEECAHFIMLGILACKQNKPIRIFTDGGLNPAAELIKTKLIKIRTSDGADYVDVTNPILLRKKAEKSYFQRNQTFFNPRKVLKGTPPRSRSNSHESSSSSSSEGSSNNNSVAASPIDKRNSLPRKDGHSNTVRIPQLNLLIKAQTHFLGNDVPIRTITDIINLLDLVINLRESSSNSPEAKRKVYEFAKFPTREEILEKIQRVITDSATPLTGLKDFRDTVQNIKTLRESAKQSDANNNTSKKSRNNSRTTSYEDLSQQMLGASSPTKVLSARRSRSSSEGNEKDAQDRRGSYPPRNATNNEASSSPQPPHGENLNSGPNSGPTTNPPTTPNTPRGDSVETSAKNVALEKNLNFDHKENTGPIDTLSF